MIKELKEFVSNLKNDCMPDISDYKGIVVIIYSPYILGAEDGMWHYVINTYEDAMSAMMRYADTACTESCVVTWNKEDGWMKVLSDIDISINNMLFRLDNPE